jgi:type IV pilus assembly protein PilO
MALLPKNPRNQVMMLACIVAVALAALYYMYVWSPKHDELVTLEVRVDSLEAANDRARLEIAKGTAAQLEAEAAQLAKDLEVMRQLVPTGNELPALLEQVSTSARRAGLEIAAVEPQPVIEGQMFDTYRYKLAATGGFHALGQFLSNVGSLTRIVAPINVSLALATNPNISAVKLKKPGTAAIESKFEIKTFVMRTAPSARGGKL